MLRLTVSAGETLFVLMREGLPAAWFSCVMKRIASPRGKAQLLHNLRRHAGHNVVPNLVSPGGASRLQRSSKRAACCMNAALCCCRPSCSTLLCMLHAGGSCTCACWQRMRLPDV